MDKFVITAGVLILVLSLGSLKGLPRFLKRPVGADADSGVQLLWIFRWVVAVFFAGAVCLLAVCMYALIKSRL